MPMMSGNAAIRKPYSPAGKWSRLLFEMATVVRRIAQWNAIANEIGCGAVVGLVPTMGALHKGHTALFEEARRRCSVVVASVFVNPLQFNQACDYDLYPRVLQKDLAFCTAHGVDYIFAPPCEEMYPEPQRTFVDVGDVSESLCGQTRPGHFRGVATVVLKLLQIVRPRAAFFGEKDYQQLGVVRRMASDLNLRLQIVGVPTVREPDGLAMSSRNRRLTLKERAFAPYLYKALSAARQAVASGERDCIAIKQRAVRVLQRAPDIKLEYLELVDPDTIRPVDVVSRPVRAAAAVWMGKTRLIDNVLCEPPTRFCDSNPIPWFRDSHIANIRTRSGLILDEPKEKDVRSCSGSY
jgi:pantoate--beta-alanine ligase